MEIQDFLTRYSIPFDASGHGKNTSGRINVRCPQCDRFPYYGIHVTKLFGNCWQCGYVNLHKALSELSRLPLSTVRELIGEPSSESLLKELHTGTLKLPSDVHDWDLDHTARQYLASRGFDPDQLKNLWGLRSIGLLGGRLSWRIFIPVHLNGRIVSWTTRKTNNTEPRYVSAANSDSAVPIEQALYGIDYVRGSCIVVEGPADAWRIGPGAVALLGLRVHNAQLNQLARLASCVICFDAEEAAQVRARKLLRDLSVLGVRVTNIVLESGSDPGSASEGEIKQLRDRFL